MNCLTILKDIWGEGATSKLPFGMHTSNPQTHEGEVFHLHSRLSKGFCDPCLGHDTIWRPKAPHAYLGWDRINQPKATN